MVSCIDADMRSRGPPSARHRVTQGPATARRRGSWSRHRPRIRSHRRSLGEPSRARSYSRARSRSSRSHRAASRRPPGTSRTTQSVRRVWTRDQASCAPRPPRPPGSALGESPAPWPRHIEPGHRSPRGSRSPPALPRRIGRWPPRPRSQPTGRRHRPACRPPARPCSPPPPGPGRANPVAPRRRSRGCRQLPPIHRHAAFSTPGIGKGCGNDAGRPPA